MEKELNLKRLIRMYFLNLWVIVLCGVIFAGTVGVFFKSSRTFTLTKQVYLVYDLQEEGDKNAEVRKNTYFDAYKALLQGNSLKNEPAFSEEERERLSNITVEVSSSCYTVTMNVPDDGNIEKDEELFARYIQASESWMKEKFEDKSLNAEVVSEDKVAVGSGSGYTMKMILGFMIGAILAAFVLFVWFVMDKKIRTEEDVTYYTDLECLGSVKRRK